MTRTPDLTTIRARIMAAMVRTASALAAGGLALGLTLAAKHSAGIPPWTYRAAIALGAVAMVMPLPAIRALLGFAALVTVANTGWPSWISARNTMSGGTPSTRVPRRNLAAPW